MIRFFYSLIGISFFPKAIGYGHVLNFGFGNIFKIYHQEHDSFVVFKGNRIFDMLIKWGALFSNVFTIYTESNILLLLFL